MSMLLLTAAISYLLGSIPFGYLLVRVARGADIRQSGSGNIGATNVARTSLALGLVTLVLDAWKGLLAVLVSLTLSRGEFIAWAYSNVPWYPDHSWNLAPSLTYFRALIAALFAVIGHMFPIWLRFRGGKGVATGLGSFVLLAPKALLVMIAIFIVILLVFRYVSLGSIVAAAVFPLMAWLVHDCEQNPQALAVMALTSILIIAKHHENIRRLLAGTESRFQLRRG